MDDSVYEQLRRAIAEGSYPAGTRLIEQMVATDLGVSRTPVREALRRLESDGLIVSHRNRGAEIPVVTYSEMLELYELRGRLEEYAAELAAERRTESDLAVLRSAAEAFNTSANEAIGPPELRDIELLRRLSVANRQFHQGVLAAAQHKRLSTVLYGSVNVPLVFQALQASTHEQLRRSAVFHLLILDAIERSAPERAGRLMREHIAQGLELVSLKDPPERG